MERTGRSDSRLVSTDVLLTAGAAPVGHETQADAARPADPFEQLALQRAVAKLVPEGYQPVRLGRFVLLDPLGKGGMGVVHVGYDDTLDRRVALKLIDPKRAANEPARRRLFREAQAMAKLSHPNVAQVFEAGEHEGHVFIAMELIEGRTLRAWNREHGHGWRDVLRLFVQVAEGLAAAHDQGVIHRDFKPDNVLVDRSDKPKVVDFGLATLDLSVPSNADSFTSGAASSYPVVRDQPLTETGEVMGTPAYMPLEQFTQRRCDAAGDQFSFCVALYESLYGERPFAGDDIAAIMRNIAAGVIEPAPPRTDVPTWLRTILVRGLSARRRDRFPDMRTLIAALSDDPHMRRRRLALRIAATTTVVGSLAAGVWVVHNRPQPCRDAEQGLGELWGDEPRARIVGALRATGVGWAEDTAVRTESALDAWAQQWQVGYLDACEDTQIRGVQSAAAMDLRVACFDRARAQLVATLEQLATADATVVEHAIPLVEALPNLAACDDLDGLRARVAPPDDPEVAAEVERLRSELAGGFALHIAGRLEAAETTMRELAERAEAVDYRPLRTEIDLTLAGVLLGRADLVGAEQLFRGVLSQALADGDAGSAARAASNLVLLLGARGTRFAEAQWLGEIALGLAQQRGEPPLVADVYNSLGGVADHQARFDEAELDFRTGLELLQSEYGDEHLEVAALHENLGTTLLGQGRLVDGLAEHRRALAIREAQLGPEHPMVGLGHLNVATSLMENGRFEESEAALRHAIDVLLRGFGPDHPDVAMAYMNLGVVLDELGKHGDAQVEYRRGIAIFERTLGADHPSVAQGYNNLATSFEDEGRLAEAEAELRRALVLSRRALGDDHPDVARSHGNLASVLVAQGRWDEAVAEAELALASSKKLLRADHPDVLYAYRGMCEAELERARAGWAEHPAAAREGGERAVAMCEAAGSEGATMLVGARAWLAEH